MLPVAAQFPDKLQMLFQPKRFKVAYGGRDGGKSWGFARALLLLMMQKPLRVLCVRELQNSIAESVHETLSSQIEKMGLSAFFKVLTTEIRCTLTGGEFQFAGIRNNTAKIKSYEDFDICWAEEAEKITKSSWNVLIPTIRKVASEIWISFNPDLATDYTYKYFVVDPPKDAVVTHMTWRDNPWYSQVLVSSREELRAKDEDAYQWVWEGKCRLLLEGAVYAKELRLARTENRITAVPYDRSLPVDVFFDLGRADNTSMWFRQYGTFQFRYINYYEANQFHIDHFIQYMQRLNYVYGTIWLPHDGKAKVLGSKLTIEEQIRAKGFKVITLPKDSIADGINAGRTIFSNCWFDEKLCEEGLECLAHYRYEKDPNTGQLSDKPLHDPYSHGADAFRYSAMGAHRQRLANEKVREAAKSTMTDRLRSALNRVPLGATGWMR